MVNNGQWMLSSGNCTLNVWMKKDDTLFLDFSLLAVPQRDKPGCNTIKLSPASITDRVPAKLRQLSNPNVVQTYKCPMKPEDECKPTSVAGWYMWGMSLHSHIKCKADRPTLRHSLAVQVCSLGPALAGQSQTPPRSLPVMLYRLSWGQVRTRPEASSNCENTSI